MTNDWMLDVLADMRSFAIMNGMHDLADQLDKAAQIARRDGAAAGGDREPRKLDCDRRSRSRNSPSR